MPSYPFTLMAFFSFAYMSTSLSDDDVDDLDDLLGFGDPSLDPPGLPPFFELFDEDDPDDLFDRDPSVGAFGVLFSNPSINNYI